MERIILPSLFLSLVLATPLAQSQESGPVSSIREATWKAYESEYPRSPLCGREELTLWSCGAPENEYALCSSRVVTRTEGYMQYRAAGPGRAEFIFPADKRPPVGTFTYDVYPNGNASVTFVSGADRYSLVDTLRGESIVLVPDSSEKASEISCGGNQTLQLNYTMRLMYESGLWQP